MEYEAVIGLEVHAQLLTETKIFCGCSTAFDAEPNIHTCPVCLGLPGALPVLNGKALEFAVMAALSLNCSIERVSRFARKNYFYPDLPKGYQISQYEKPLAGKGYLEIDVNGRSRRIRIQRIHMEEDAGKLFHEAESTLVDFNRCGIPLVEIVTEPDMRSPQEAVAYLDKLRAILRYLKVCDGNMEEASLRCDANLSLRRKGDTHLGVRSELKNMNSFKGLRKALDYEIQRQRALLEDSGNVLQETRLWDENRRRTVPMRGKEESSDYRYFPEPDLPPIVIETGWTEDLRRRLPELPDEKTARFVTEKGLSPYDAGVLTSSRDLAEYFESCEKHAGDTKMAAKWVINELLGELKRDGREIKDCPVAPEDLGDLITCITGGRVSGRMAKDVFEEMYRTGKGAAHVIEKHGEQITDEDEIVRAAREVLARYSNEAKQYREGDEKILKFLMGRVMEQTAGRANPRLARKILGRLMKE